MQHETRAPSAQPVGRPSAGATPEAGGRLSPRRRLAQRHRDLRARIQRRPALFLAYRIFIGVAGFLVTALGIFLLPFPGPGWLIIFAGLGIWATEFAWAQRLLRWTRRQVTTWTRWVQRQSPGVKATLAAVTLVVVVAVVWGYLAWRGAPGWVPFLNAGWGKLS